MRHSPLLDPQQGPWAHLQLTNMKPHTGVHCRVPSHPWVPARSPPSFLPFSPCGTRTHCSLRNKAVPGLVTNWWEEAPSWLTTFVSPRGQKDGNCEKEFSSPGGNFCSRVNMSGWSAPKKLCPGGPQSEWLPLQGALPWRSGLGFIWEFSGRSMEISLMQTLHSASPREKLCWLEFVRISGRATHTKFLPLSNSFPLTNINLRASCREKKKKEQGLHLHPEGNCCCPCKYLSL